MNRKIIIGALSFTVLVLVSGASFIAIRNQTNNLSSTNITLDTQGTNQVGSNADIAAEVTEKVTPTPTEEEATPAKMQDGVVKEETNETKDSNQQKFKITREELQQFLVQDSSVISKNLLSANQSVPGDWSVYTNNSLDNLGINFHLPKNWDFDEDELRLSKYFKEADITYQIILKDDQKCELDLIPFIERVEVFSDPDDYLKINDSDLIISEKLEPQLSTLLAVYKLPEEKISILENQSKLDEYQYPETDVQGTVKKVKNSEYIGLPYFFVEDKCISLNGNFSKFIAGDLGRHIEVFDESSTIYKTIANSLF